MGDVTRRGFLARALGAAAALVGGRAVADVLREGEPDYTIISGTTSGPGVVRWSHVPSVEDMNADWDDLMAGNVSEIEMQHWLAQNWEQFIPLLANAAPLLILAVVLGLLAFYIMPAVILGWLKEDSITAAFSWNVVKKTVSLDYLVNWLIVGYLIGLVNSLLQWIPILGVGITMYVGGVFSYTVFSEVYERGQ